MAEDVIEAMRFMMSSIRTAYNLIQIPRTLRMSPAMAAGVADRFWSVADLVALWESEERRLERAA